MAPDAIDLWRVHRRPRCIDSRSPVVSVEFTASHAQDTSTASCPCIASLCTGATGSDLCAIDETRRLRAPAECCS
jgi:hypothetical protein